MISQSGPIWDIWNVGGPFVGTASAPVTKIFVERRYAGGAPANGGAEDNWSLKEFNQTVNVGTGQQVNWGRSWFWQNLYSTEWNFFTHPNGPNGDDPILREIPNIQSVTIDRSVDAPAATLKFTIYNQNLTAAVTKCDTPGTPGYYTWNQGEDPASAARWNRGVNDWHNVIWPNALLRSYSGYGGTDLSLSAALASGNLVPTGVWLIDEVRVTTDGKLEVTARDTCKLLIEQRCFPFTVPQPYYPLKYARWIADPANPARQIAGNYRDYAEIVDQLLKWCGWAIWGGSINGDINVYGNVDRTGVPGSGTSAKDTVITTLTPDQLQTALDAGFNHTDPDRFVSDLISANTSVVHANTYTLAEDFFDKKPPIDVITQLKELVGYHFWIDSYGRARFETPNWWLEGNIINNARVRFIPDIDETRQLTDLTVSLSDKAARTGLMFLPRLPSNGIGADGWINSNSDTYMHGIFKLAIWINDIFADRHTADVMAQLVDMQIMRALRTYSITAVANPCIELNDQVWIFERQSSTNAIHYVKGITTTHDLDSGSYTMNLSTTWLGTFGDTRVDSDWLAQHTSPAIAGVGLNNVTAPTGDASSLDGTL